MHLRWVEGGGGMTLRIIACHLRLLILSGDIVCSVWWERKGEAGKSDLLNFCSAMQPWIYEVWWTPVWWVTLNWIYWYELVMVAVDISWCSKCFSQNYTCLIKELQMSFHSTHLWNNFCWWCYKHNKNLMKSVLHAEQM